MDETILTQSNIGDLLNTLIADEWESVSKIRGALSLLQSLDSNHELEDIFNDILNDYLIHIGQLEKGLQTVVPAAVRIEDGKEEAEKQLEEIPDDDVEVQVGENLEEAIYSDNVPDYVHIASVGLFSTGCDPQEYEKEKEVGHYEIDLDNKIYTRVKNHGYLGKWFIESFPRDTMAEVESTAKNIMRNGDFKEVSNDEYVKIQEDWNK